MAPEMDELITRLDGLASRVEETRDRLRGENSTQYIAECGRALVLGLIDEISALVSLVAPTLTPQRLTPERFKDYLADDRSRIRLHDLLVREVKSLQGRLADGHFPVHNDHNLSIEDYLGRVALCESLTRPLQSVMAALAYWGDEGHGRLIARCMARLADPPGDRSGNLVGHQSSIDR